MEIFNINPFVIPCMMIFIAGIIGVFSKKNLLVIFMSIELMLCSAMILMVSFSAIYGNPDGGMFSFFIITIAAAEVSLALAIIVQFYKLRGSINISDVDTLGD